MDNQESTVLMFDDMIEKLVAISVTSKRLAKQAMELKGNLKKEEAQDDE